MRQSQPFPTNESRPLGSDELQERHHPQTVLRKSAAAGKVEGRAERPTCDAETFGVSAWKAILESQDLRSKNFSINQPTEPQQTLHTDMENRCLVPRQSAARVKGWYDWKWTTRPFLLGLLHAANLCELFPVPGALLGTACKGHEITGCAALLTRHSSCLAGVTPGRRICRTLSASQIVQKQEQVLERRALCDIMRQSRSACALCHFCLPC